MRVLLVEDEERLGAMIKHGLEKLGFAVDHIMNGEEAAEHLFIHHQNYDVVVLDLMLPGRSGLDICRSARERDIQTPVIVLTARSETAEKVQLLNSGADDYLTKPFTFEELVARMHALLRRPENSLPTELILGDLRIDTGQHKVYLGDEEVPLTVKEFALLEFFMRNPDRALDREYILDHVWDFNYNSFSNVVDVHVKNLRNKLGQTEGRVFIETVEGVGYRLATEVQA